VFSVVTHLLYWRQNVWRPDTCPCLYKWDLQIFYIKLYYYVIPHAYMRSVTDYTWKDHIACPPSQCDIACELFTCMTAPMWSITLWQDHTVPKSHQSQGDRSHVAGHPVTCSHVTQPHVSMSQETSVSRSGRPKEPNWWRPNAYHHLRKNSSTNSHRVTLTRSDRASIPMDITFTLCQWQFLGILVTLRSILCDKGCN
jgi:hypothetical protein